MITDHRIVEQHLPITAEVAGEEESAISLLLVNIVRGEFGDVCLLQLHRIVCYATWVTKVWILNTHVLLFHVSAMVTALEERPKTAIEVALVVPHCTRNTT